MGDGRNRRGQQEIDAEKICPSSNTIVKIPVLKLYPLGESETIETQLQPLTEIASPNTVADGGSGTSQLQETDPRARKGLYTDYFYDLSYT